MKNNICVSRGLSDTPPNAGEENEAFIIGELVCVSRFNLDINYSRKRLSGPWELSERTGEV